MQTLISKLTIMCCSLKACSCSANAHSLSTWIAMSGGSRLRKLAAAGGASKLVETHGLLCASLALFSTTRGGWAGSRWRRVGRARLGWLILGGPGARWADFAGLPGHNPWKFWLPEPVAAVLSRHLYCRPWGKDTQSPANHLAYLPAVAFRVAAA